MGRPESAMMCGMSNQRPSLPAATAIGQVGLTVSDLGRAVGYYTGAIGLTPLEHSSTEVVLGTGETPLVHLVEEPGVTPSVGYTGLFHIALRVPQRADLARWLAHAAASRVPLGGMSDHFVSEAIYLTDPDGHGIEIYADRPREVWEGRVSEMSTLALDVESLFGEISTPPPPFEGMPPGTDMGHVHLKVADVAESVAFYRDVLGFDLMTTYGAQAAFLSAGGYHHHIGANTWQSQGAPPEPDGVAGLRYATITFPDAASRDAAAGRVAAKGGDVADAPRGPVVRDPAGNALLLGIA
jgi:catechol 2,3-dioxygenase